MAEALGKYLVGLTDLEDKISNIPSPLREKVVLAVGDEYVRAGECFNAAEFYTMAKSLYPTVVSDKLTGIVDESLMSKNKLAGLREAESLKLKNIRDATHAAKLLGDVSKLIEVGKAAFEDRRYGYGIEALNEIVKLAKDGREVPSTELIELADTLLSKYEGKRYIDYELIRIYELANETEKLIDFGREKLEEGDIDTALKAFEPAGYQPQHDELVNCGRKSLERRSISSALGAYELAKEPIPVEEFIKAGDKALEKREVSNAIKAYEAVKSLGKLDKERVQALKFIKKTTKRLIG